MADLNFAAALTAATPDQFFRLEQDAGRATHFTDVDRLAVSVLTAALSGNKAVDITPGRRGEKHGDILRLPTLTKADRDFINRNFALSVQQSRGSWLLPEQASLKTAAMNLPAYLRHSPWYAITLSADDNARVSLDSTPDAPVTWAVLSPLFDILLAPVTKRAAGSTQPPEEQRLTWATIMETYEHLGIQPDPRISVFTYGGGWSGLDRTGQGQARVALLDALASNDLSRIVARFRAKRVQTLVSATVKKSKKGTPLARQVLTKSLQGVLSAYFGGDWLAFLGHLGMAPNPNEEIITALPEPKLYVGGSTKAADVATQLGLDTDDVHAILAAFMGQTTSVSPVERRVDTLNRWWTEFDDLHARQVPGMPSLWGLVEDAPYTIGYGQGPTPQLFRQLLTPNLVNDVNHLWDGVTLARWPTAIVSEPYPHKLMAETLGPAATFWHGVALTAWYVCEGPYSRTPLPGLRNYYERDLAGLTDAGTPIHDSLFAELESAERHLGPPRDLESHVQELPLPNRSIGIRMSGGGQRRDGFEILRDIITRHRHGWTRRYFADYLQHRWNHELGTVTRELHRHIAAKGKAPTFRQFAKIASPAANHWFNGDLSGLYTAIGEKAPATPKRVDLLPTGAHDFVDAVYTTLGGERYDEHLRITDFPAADRYRQQARLAAASVYYLQITEALGRTPEPAEFNANRHEWEWAGGIEAGWPIYQNAIEKVRADNRG
ncbi:MAG: hypothetical protein JXA67_18170 [Micromonosporaceae bacterium]|nr:hypothetical protein [Micromonosporaceae bacterium]